MQEVVHLSQHRPDIRDLEAKPLQRDRLLVRALGPELAGLLREIDQDRAGFHERDRLAAGTVRIDDGRNLVVRADLEEIGLELVALWTMISLIFHAVRLAQANARADRGATLASWLA